MRDRIPTHAGRIKLTPVDASNGIYDMERADAPVEEGTPINKSTMLTDEAASNLGIGVEDPTLNDAFLRVAEVFSEVYNAIDNIEMPKIESGFYKGTASSDEIGEEYGVTLTFSFTPKFFAIYARRSASSATSWYMSVPNFFVWGDNGWHPIVVDNGEDADGFTEMFMRYSGNSVTYYTTSSQDNATSLGCFNKSNNNYYYFAIG